MTFTKPLLLSAALGLTGGASFAEDLALAIGVARYENLPNVRDGAEVMDEIVRMRRFGFDVFTAADPTAARQIDVLEEFTALAPNADRMVIALSGNFMTDGRTTWFLREDSRALNLFNAPRNAIVVDSLLTLLAEADGEAILLLGTGSGQEQFDPFTQLGIGDLDVPRGVTVITGPSSLMDNLIEEGLARPGANLRSIVDRNRNFRVIGEMPRRLIFVTDQDRRAGQNTQGRAEERQIWNQVVSENTIEAYRAYLGRYPRGVFADEARQAIRAIENDPIRLAEEQERDLRIDRALRRRLQGNLTALGYDTNGVDGVFGRGTRAAIRAWQTDNGHRSTGYLTAAQIREINAQATETRAAQDRADWRRAERLDTSEGYEWYLERHPNGQFADIAAQRVRPVIDTTPRNDEDGRPSRNDVSRAQAQEEQLGLNRRSRQILEIALLSLGFRIGAPDGTFDRQARAGIEAYQRQRGVPATGFITPETLEALVQDGVRLR